MTAATSRPFRPTWRQRLADLAVARLIKTPGAGHAYQRLSAAIPMRDGASLCADVYLPAQPRATVLIRSPYGRGFPLDLLHARVFARHGYQVVVQSVRGRSGSTGEFQPAINEAHDGRDTVTWLRDQDWYSGRLATFGGSYLGLLQWMLLTDPPQELGASVIVVGPHDFARAMWGAGAFALNDMFGWSQAMVAPEEGGALRRVTRMRSMQRRAAEVMNQLPVSASSQAALGDGAPWFREWLSHDRLTDPFWDAYRAGDALKNSDVPTLLIGGWNDAFIDQTLEQYDALHSRGVDVALTVGPWTHMETATKAAGHVTREALEWLDQCFGSGDRRDGVRAFVTGSNEWRTLDSWPPPTSAVQLHIAANRLVDGSDDGGTTTFTFDPTNPTPAMGGRSIDPTGAGTKDNRALIARDDVVAFTGDALPAGLDICGAPELELYLSTANPHSDVFVRLCDVDPKGNSRNVADAFTRLDPDVPAGEAQHIRLTLDPCWHQVPAGHRLQLVVAGGAHPRFARNPGTSGAQSEGSDFEAQPHTLHHGGTVLRLPVRTAR